MGYLVAGVAVVVLAGAVADLLYAFDPGQTTDRILQSFSLMSDASVPTYVASMLLLACGFLLAVSAKLEAARATGHAKSWWLLSGIFCLLSLDEVATLHELSGVVLARLVPAVGATGGIFYYSWTLIGIPFVLVLALVLLRWFLALPVRTRLRFGAAAFIFLSGAVGVEMLNSVIDEATAGRSMAYSIFSSIEESLEFAGVLMFLYGLLDHLRRMGASVTFSVGAAHSAPAVAGRQRGAPSIRPAGSPAKGWFEEVGEDRVPVGQAV